MNEFYQNAATPEDNFIFKNNDHFYNLISTYLEINHSVMFSWADSRNTVQLDVIMNYQSPFPYDKNMFRRGLKENYLYVSVIDTGAFGFNISNIENLHPNYVAEKLFLDYFPLNISSEIGEFTTLIEKIGARLNHVK